MNARLSVLDLSPIRVGETAADAIRETVALAQAADALGYNRFWVAEHHSTRSFASGSPEILIAAISQKTARIRIGSGGVMLVNYSPLKVAEQFMELEALAPGRIDLGVGRALGADPRTGAALRSAGSEAFGPYFALLNAWLLDAAGREAFPPSHGAHGIRAQPTGPSHPDVFVLCTSTETAAFAGMAGVGMVFAEFIARREATEAIAAYRAAFQPSVFRSEPWAGAGLAALAADTAKEARRLDSPRRAWGLAFAEGRQGAFLGIDAALADLEARGAEAAPADDPRLGFVGDGETVRAALAAKAQTVGADELFLITFAPTLAARVHSLELLRPQTQTGGSAEADPPAKSAN
jgi:luciferase family oxidoreductase group 1